MNITLFEKEISIDKKKIIILIAIPIIAIVLGVFGYIKLHNNDNTVFIGKEIDTASSAKSSTQESTAIAAEVIPTEKPEIKDEIKIYIVGCVKNEGIVTLKKGQIIYDAVELAGGLTKEADKRSINMAYILTENTMIKVKSWKENSTETQSPIKPKTQPQNSEAGTGIEIVKSSGGAVLNESKSEEKSKGKINLNTASLEELDTLPRIGEKTANDIIAYREKSGGFKKIEDLMEVPRIGEKTFADLKDLIDVK